MSDIYEQHAKAFRDVEAAVVLHDGEAVAKIAFKFPRDGAGRLYAYVHWLGVPMARGYASGYGYDKRTAACASAMRKLVMLRDDGGPAEQFWHALKRDGGATWDSALRAAGFTVVNAI